MTSLGDSGAARPTGFTFMGWMVYGFRLVQFFHDGGDAGLVPHS